jgi:hypothetical protein
MFYIVPETDFLVLFVTFVVVIRNTYIHSFMLRPKYIPF